MAWRVYGKRWYRRTGNPRLVGPTLKRARHLYGLLLWRRFYGRTQRMRAGKPY